MSTLERSTQEQNQASTRLAEYKVKRGDNLSSLAKKYMDGQPGSLYEKTQKLITLNGLSNDTIRIGQVLKIPVTVSTNASTTVAPQGDPRRELQAPSSPHLNDSAPTTQPSSPPKATASVYTVGQGDSLWKIASTQLPKELGDIPTRIALLKTTNKLTSDQIAIGDKLILPLSEVAAPSTQPAVNPSTQPAAKEIDGKQNGPFLRVSKGQLTFDAEGVEAAGRYFSRVIHKPPGDASGVTIGRGYDMGKRHPATVLKDMLEAGVPEPQARLLALGAGWRGKAAQDFVAANKHLIGAISLQQQQKLFSDVVYPQYEARLYRIVSQREDVAGNCTVNWTKIDPAMLEVLVDLVYRGDFTQETQKQLIPILVENNPDSFKAFMSNRERWRHVPLERVKAREEWLRRIPASNPS